MDNHPIPQDVTGFKFTLIGNITVKQFGYILGGILLGWFIYGLGIFFLFKVVLIPLVIGLGLFLAFIPIEGRPADVMAAYFFKALFTPNQYVFDKQGVSSGIPQAASVQVSSVQPPVVPQTPPIPPLPTPSPEPVAPAPITSSTHEEEKAEAMPFHAVEKPHSIEPYKEELMEEEQLPQATLVSPNENSEVAMLKQQLAEAMQKMKQLEDALQKQTGGSSTQQPMTQTTSQKPLLKSNPSALPQTPNMLSGVVSDPRGNVLPHILVEVTDAQGNPVRAFKTNQMGKFASATPLSNNTYSITLEDPESKHSFSPLSITMKGEVMEPLTITSIDERERLRKELFG